MNVLDVFSGIGGFSLGLERAGMRTVYFCEIDPYCRAVLAKHWPGVPCHDDINTFPALTGELPWIDVICGGFPCQDISIAGAGAGLAGERSGLWKPFCHLIGLIQPRYAILENVSALLHRGLGEVLGDLAAIGYDAEWHCIPAATVGAPHRRDRIWIVAYPHSQRKLQPPRPIIEVWRWLGDSGAMGDADSAGLAQRETSTRQAGEAHGGFARNHAPVSGQWSSEPDVGRVAHGVPARVDRIRTLGNSVVPQIPEIIGRAIMRHSHNSLPCSKET